MEAGGRSGASGTPRFARAELARRRRMLRHGLPLLVVLALGALVVGVLVGRGPGRAEHRTAERFARAWERGDFPAMYALLDGPVRARIGPSAFAAAYRDAAETATVRLLDVGRVGHRDGDAIPLHVTLRTRIFGTIHGVVRLPVRGSGEEMRIAWGPQAVFPGLAPGERLTRTTTLPPRAALLARDGTVLAAGTDRRSAVPDIAGHVVGRLEPAPAEEQAAMRALGYPDGAPVGVSGLERVFQAQLAGRPGGELLAGGRVVARARARAGRAVRTTIDPVVERAAVSALAGRYGGIAAVDPRSGAILALAGVAYSALQPPGSTFKIVTATGALEARIAKLSSTYPVTTGAAIEGVTIENANGESCGGTLLASFARSCNSVFAPLGAKLGARRLVDVARRYGFGEPPPIPGAAESTIPSADEIGDALAVGSSAIGQGRVQATALQMTLVAATIAMRGRRPEPALALHARPVFHRATSRHVARLVARMMRAVVQFGTGVRAGIPGVDVAGKTGTAELKSTVPTADAQPPADQRPQDAPPPPETDAWFAGYAPAPHPRIAVGALFVEAGAGGDVAAPAVRQVLIAALQRPR